MTAGRLYLGPRSQVLTVDDEARYVEVDVLRLGTSEVLGRAVVDLVPDRAAGYSVRELRTRGELEAEQVPALVQLAELEYRRREVRT